MSIEKVTATEKEINLYKVEEGDLFFCRSSLKKEGIGWCAYAKDVNEPIVFECHLMRIRPDKNRLDSEYLAHYWRNPILRKSLIENSRTSTMTTMNQDDLSKIQIPLPPLHEQKRLAKLLTEKMVIIDQLEETLLNQLESVRKIHPALLKQAFNGEL